MRSVTLTVLPLLSAMLVWPSAVVAAQAAALAGIVLTDSTERPIANAEVAIPTLSRSVRSDSAGNFLIASVPAGVHRVIVRAVGREPLEETIAFDATGRVERDYLLAPATTTLAEVEVTADGSLEAMRLAEFNDRRALGIGRFLTRDDLDKANGRDLDDVLIGRIPGVRSVVVGSARAMISSRGPPSRRGPPACFVKVIVDGMVRYNGSPPLFDINNIDPTDIAGIEYFTSAQTPAEFNGTGSPCGTLVIWTRGR